MNNLKYYIQPTTSLKIHSHRNVLFTNINKIYHVHSFSKLHHFQKIPHGLGIPFT